MIVPYITTWSEENELPALVVERQGLGIGYADETLVDRDDNGVLWRRISHRPGQGRPLFGKVHALRQRRAMRRLLCQVCSGPADRSEAGVLWLVPNFGVDEDWPDWPERMAATEPPICLSCVHASIRLCPGLRRGYSVIRVGHFPIGGVYGIQYRSGHPLPTEVTDAFVAYDDPRIRWVCAGQLVRELFKCTPVDLDPPPGLP